MTSKTKKLSLLAITFGVSFSLHAESVLVPNGDFELPGGANWGEAGDPNTTFSYPASGGNTGGYGVMENNGTPFGVLISNDGDPIPLGDLGLTAGRDYNFFQDMRIDFGSSIGTLKIEYYNAAGERFEDTNDIPNTLIGDGSTWETYVFPEKIPADTVSIKIVPIWGAGSAVGYDNIGVDNTPIVIPPGPRIPNGDFETADGSRWSFNGSEGATDSYPAADGNPGGFAQIDASAGGSGTLSSNSNAVLGLSSIGLTAGETYTFSVDMKIISGANIGGFRVEYVPTGSGVLRPDLIGDGSTWETYTFDLTIRGGSGGIIIYLHSGEDSIVAFDNVDVIIPESEPFLANIRKGTTVNWTLEGDGLIYQPQGSFDGEEWDNIGPAIQDDAVTSAFAEVAFPLYRVSVSQNVAINAALNGDFEENFLDPSCADSWTCATTSGQPPTRTTDDAHSGDASIRIAVQNDKTKTANQSELQQNIANAGGSITAGESYEFSFWAKQISGSDTYVQNYRVQWLADDGAPLGGTGFTQFTGGTGVWEKISVSGLVAPEDSASAYIQIFGATGAVPSADEFGEVLIDDLKLTANVVEPFEDFLASSSEGVEISWPTEEGQTYQVESSADMNTFTNFGAPRLGTGEVDAIADALSVERMYYRVIKN